MHTPETFSTVRRFVLKTQFVLEPQFGNGHAASVNLIYCEFNLSNLFLCAAKILVSLSFMLVEMLTLTEPSYIIVQAYNNLEALKSSLQRIAELTRYGDFLV